MLMVKKRKKVHKVQEDRRTAARTVFAYFSPACLSHYFGSSLNYFGTELQIRITKILGVKYYKMIIKLQDDVGAYILIHSWAKY